MFRAPTHLQHGTPIVSLVVVVSGRDLFSLVFLEAVMSLFITLVIIISIIIIIIIIIIVILICVAIPSSIASESTQGMPPTLSTPSSGKKKKSMHTHIQSPHIHPLHTRPQPFIVYTSRKPTHPLIPKPKHPLIPPSFLRSPPGRLNHQTGGAAKACAFEDEPATASTHETMKQEST